MKNSTQLILKKSVVAQFNSNVSHNNLQQKSLPNVSIFNTFKIW